MTYKKENNFAFIDSQNLNLGIRELGWGFDYEKLRKFLKHKYYVEVAYVFIGYLPKYKSLYRRLRKAGFVICFKEITRDNYGKVKGNVDAELVLQAMHDYRRYDKAVIVSGDGDFACLVNYLRSRKKLKCVLAPHSRSCSALLKKAAKGKLDYLKDMRHMIEYKK